MRRSLLLVTLAALACGAPADDTAPASGEEAASISSGEPRVLYNVAVCEKALGQYARAIGTLKRSLTPTGHVLPSDYTQRVAETIATLSRYVAFVTRREPC